MKSAAAVSGWVLRFRGSSRGAGLLCLRRWEWPGLMTSSLFMVYPIRCQPQQFKIDLPRVSGSGLILIPPPGRKDKIKQFRMCLGNIHNPEDTKTSTNLFKGHWCLTGWIASTFCSMGSWFKEPLVRFNRAPVLDLTYLAICLASDRMNLPRAIIGYILCKRVKDQLTEMNMEKLSYSNEENCHKLVSTESFGMEAVSTWSVVVVLSCYLKVDEPKDYRKLNGKLLEDILELLGPQELVNVCLFWNAIVAVFPMAELNEEYGYYLFILLLNNFFFLAYFRVRIQ